MKKSTKIYVKETKITVISHENTDLICLWDMTAGFAEGSGFISKWITNKNTLDYLGIWKKINNTDFNYPEFRVIEHCFGVC